MGTLLKDIVRVNITRETARVTRKGFGTALIFGALTEFTGRYRIYNAMEAVEADFATTTEQWKAAAKLFGQAIAPERIVIGHRDITNPLSDELAAMEAAFDDWYALVLTRHGVEADQLADITAAATWIEPRNKIFIAAIGQDDMAATATTDIASTLKAAGYDRCAVVFSSDHGDYPEAAWLGRCLPEDPGAITWKFKTLAGFDAEVLTATEAANLKSKNANFYEQVAGVKLISSEAVMASGEYIDIIRGCDWLTARIAEGVFLRLANADKIPFTAQGIAVIENEIRYRLEKGVDSGLLVSGSIKINAPSISAVDPLEKANRFLNNLMFSAQLAGAVHKTTIAGRLTL